MERPHSLTASSSSSSSNNYDVFLSFRGETRNNFTAHLYRALRQGGIHTFLDDDKLERGEPISSELLRAIEGSQCLVVILSSDYASSRWCLDELVEFLRRMNDSEQIVLPIFYHVDPSDVRNQTGSIGDAIQIHERNNPKKVQTWRSALREVGNLAGWHLNGDKNEAELILDLVEKVSRRVYPPSKISEDLVGMDSRLGKLSECVSKSSFTGICGMVGIGKTTLARAYFANMSNKYEASSFLADVRDRCESSRQDGLVKLQNQLLSDILKGKHEVRDVEDGKAMISRRLSQKRALVILDDVNHLEQIAGLAERKEWFGDGSRIILTTRDGSLLNKAYKEKEYVIHEVDKLDKREARDLFSRIAFKSNGPEEDYKQLSDKAIEYADGLPLALKNLGSFLLGKTPSEWESAWNRQKEYPNMEIMGSLLISFNGLQETEKNIFLNIACFFNGHDRRYVTEIMDICGYFGGIGIRTLLDKSLLHRDDDDTLRMRDLLQEMGREIAIGKLGDEPRRRSRIWLGEDCFLHDTNTDTGVEEVEAMVCPTWRISVENILRALSNMKKLRLLIMTHEPLLQNYFPDKLSYLPSFEYRFNYFPNELRYLVWNDFPFNYFPQSFQPQGPVELQLSYRQIERMKPLRGLKYINLAYSVKIHKLEDFSSFPYLEKLILDFCVELEEIHPSIAVIKSLTLLSLKSCEKLNGLPRSKHGLKSLKILDLEGCGSLGNLAEDLGCLNKLEELNVSFTAIKGVPSFISGLEALKSLNCTKTFLGSHGRNPSSAGLHCLKKLELSGCVLVDGAIPDDFGWLVSLEHLGLSWNCFSCLPACINRLSKLRYLYLDNCWELRSLGPELPDNLEMVRVDNCQSLHTFLDPLKPCNLRCSATCYGCIKLVDQQGSKRTALTSLGRHLQKPFSCPSSIFHIVLPAGDDEIPSWFTHQSQGSSSASIRLPLHPKWCNNDWMGFALCACSVLGFADDLRWEIKIDNEDWGFGLLEYLACGDQPSAQYNHLSVLYLPRKKYFHTKWLHNFCDQIEFSLLGSKVETKIGARLVYKRDIEELNKSAIHEPLEPSC